MNFVFNMLTLGTLMMLFLATHAAVTRSDEKVCRYLGKEFHVGELVTGDVCDQCYCTQHGIMCQMIGCAKANCHDKIMGECCYECPNGPNCLHEGRNGSVLVPETGCTYGDGVVCHCYHDNRMADKMETYCLPVLPGDSPPACNATAN